VRSRGFAAPKPGGPTRPGTNSSPSKPGRRYTPGSWSSSTRRRWAGTATLDELVRQAGDAAAKVVLVGDHYQLSAVDAGGAFRLLAESGDPATLTALWRFRHRWEAGAPPMCSVGCRGPDVTAQPWACRTREEAVVHAGSYRAA